LQFQNTGPQIGDTEIRSAELAQGVAWHSIAFSLQVALLRSLVAMGTMTPAQAQDVIENALTASSKEERDVALVTVEALKGSGRA